MKRFLVLFFAFGLAALPAFAIKKKINGEVTATNGCKFRVTGWVDVGCCPSINSYDVTMSGPCGTFHFQGKMVNPSTGEPWPPEAEPTNAFSMTLTDQDTGEEVPPSTQTVNSTLPELLILAQSSPDY